MIKFTIFRDFWNSIRTWPKKIGSWFVMAYRIVWSSALAFSKNDDYLKASALTFYTLISIVPFLAVAFGIATGFGFQEYLENELKQVFEEQEEAIGYAIKFAHTLLINAKGSLIAGIGLVALFWTNISMLGSIENALNEIWRVRQPRSWSKKLADYLAAMIICPIFLVVSSSLSVYLVTRITETAKENKILEVVSPFLLFLFKLAPFFLSALLFIVVYLFIPNVRVRARPRIIAGILAGIAFQLWQLVYIKFQVEISNYNVIYGTFAALPLFLLWLQISWIILLAGAEMAAHIENEMVYIQDGNFDQFYNATQKQLGLMILYRCVSRFIKGENPPTTLDIARELEIPLINAQQVIDILEDGGLLVEVGTRGSSRIGFQPSRDARLFTIKSVCDAIEKQTSPQIPVKPSAMLDRITACLEDLDKMEATAPSNVTFQYLIDKVQS